MRPLLAQPALGFPHDESANLLPRRKQITTGRLKLQVIESRSNINGSKRLTRREP
jgi:hypothetical protein